MHEISFEKKFDLNIDVPPSPCAKMHNVNVEMFGNFYSDGDGPCTSYNFEINSD